jgi:hypothetical protein
VGGVVDRSDDERGEQVLGLVAGERGARPPTAVADHARRVEAWKAMRCASLDHNPVMPPVAE